ncbi:MAG: hypothetical protein ACRDX8_05025 [Acidimicrobiales bacterium]
MVFAAVAGSAGYATWLLRSGSGVPPWLIPLVLVVAVLCAGVLVRPLFRRTRSRLTRRVIPRRLSGALLALSALAMLIAPSAAAASLAYGQLGAFDTPFQPSSITKFTQTDQREGLAVSRTQTTGNEIALTL